MITLAWPSLEMREYVSAYIEQRGPGATAGAPIPAPANTVQGLAFYFRNRAKLRRCDTGALELAPISVVIGPHTYRRVDVCLDDEIESFGILFQPTGFYRLFAVPARALLNSSSDTREVLGSLVVDLEYALEEAPTLDARVHIAEKFLKGLAARSKVSDRVSRLTTAMMESQGSARVQRLALEAAISERQMHRSFLDQTGLSPKLFARVTRFNAALHEKLANPDERWTDVAQAVGYFDQSHMLRDFQAFGATSPTNLISELQHVPHGLMTRGVSLAVKGTSF